MPLLSKLLVEQKNIFLAPGEYFHSEFIGTHYHQLPHCYKNSRILSLLSNISWGYRMKIRLFCRRSWQIIGHEYPPSHGA